MVHDHTDGELVLIGKLALARHLNESRSAAHTGSTAFALLIIAVIILGTAFLAGDWRDVGPLSGDVVGAFVLGLGIAGILLGIHLMISWLDIRDRHSAEAVLERLTTPEPRRLRDLPFTSEENTDPRSDASDKNP